MQVGIRSLLTVALAIGAVACTVNDKGLGTGDAGASNTGHAGTGAPSPGAAGMSGAAGGSPTGTGLAGSTGGSSPTGAAGNGTAGTGAAGDLSGGAGTNGASGVTGNAGTSGGGAGSTGDAGVAGTAGAGGTTAGSGGAGIGSSGGTGGSAGGRGGAGAAGTGVVGTVGCSDGTREGYLDRVAYPHIAACEGAWDDPGLASLDSRAPQCDRRAGNDGDKADGRGCSVTDLCASGWSVCETAHAVSAYAPSGCTDAIVPYGDKPVFFLTRQRGTGLVCDPNNQMGTNNLYGCGNIGSVADKSCAPFKTMLRDSDCAMNWPWVCAEGPIGTSQNEYGVVTKDGPSKGGVLCCKN